MHITLTPFLEEARQLADDEHYTLGLELEAMRDDQCVTWQDIVWWKRDCEWQDDPADYFETHREAFLEEARQRYAECAA
jgi:hypothetical protein